MASLHKKRELHYNYSPKVYITQSYSLLHGCDVDFWVDLHCLNMKASSKPILGQNAQPK